MKRYGLSIAFVLLIVISIGTFYIQATASTYPDFKLIKQYGDESEIEGVLLKGKYSNYLINPTIIVNAAGSQYMTDRSLFEIIDPFYWENEEVKQLVSKHRQFMRGKRGYYGIYEDDHHLVYADVKSDDPFSSGVRRFYFEVSVLDKKQNKSWSYEVNVPNEKLDYYINVEDVQVFGDEIVIVTSNNNAVGREYHRYTLDLIRNRAPLDQVIILPQPENVVIEGSGTVVNFHVQSAYETDITEPSNYSVFYALQTQALVEDANTYNAPEPGINAIQMAQRVQTSPQEIVGAQIVVYDLRTGLEVMVDNQLLIDFIVAQSESDFLNVNMDGDNLFLTKQSERGVKVMEYNISDSKAIIHDVHLDNPTAAVILKEIKDDRLYLLNEDIKDRSQRSIVIVDLNSDGTIYKGTIELNETVRYQANELNKLHFNNMDIK